MEAADFISQYKNKLLNIAVIIIALIIANNIYKAQGRGILELRQEKETEIKKNETLSDISRLEERLKDYKPLIDRKDVGGVLNNINSLAREASVKVDSIKPEKEVASRFFTKYPFALIVKADSYHNLGKFIASLENHPDVYSLETTSIIEEPGEEIRASRLTATLALNTYLVRD